MKTIISALESRPKKWFPKSQSGAGKRKSKKAPTKLKLTPARKKPSSKPKKKRNFTTKDLKKSKKSSKKKRA